MRNKRLIALLSIVTAFVLIAVVCGATFLVRHVEVYSYYVNSPEEYDQKVIDAAGIKKNSSIFFLDEVGIKQRVESAYPEVGVINIERKFPDRVSINYVVYGKSFQYYSGGKYYQCYSSGRIGSVTDAPVTRGYFNVIPRGATSSSVGSLFQSEDGFDYVHLMALIQYLHNANVTSFTDEKIAERIYSVDFSSETRCYIKTRIGNTVGCTIELHDLLGGFSDIDKFVSLFDAAWQLFIDPDPSSPVEKASGTIISWYNNGESTPTASWVDNDEAEMDDPFAQ